MENKVEKVEKVNKIERVQKVEKVDRVNPPTPLLNPLNPPTPLNPNSRPILPIIFLFLLILGAGGFFFWRGIVKKQPFFQKAQPTPSPAVVKVFRGVGLVTKIEDSKLTVQETGSGIIYELIFAGDTIITQKESSSSAMLSDIKLGGGVTFTGKQTGAARERLDALHIEILTLDEFVPRTGR